MDAISHYRDLLAFHYSWMLGGDIEQLAVHDRQMLEGLGVSARGRNVAVDLGCGPGPQSIALADMGFGTVIGVDTSQELLDELARHADSRSAVQTVCGDLVEALPTIAAPGSVDLMVCMRDTLLHLPDRDAVDLFLARAASALAPGGTLVLTYRDLSQELSGTDRFLPVRSDPERIMLCALDYDSPETVTVNDLVYTWTTEGWVLQKSSYPKLRIAPGSLTQRLEAEGFSVTQFPPEPGGMWTTVARK